MRRLTVAVALLTLGASEAQAFDCPNTGDDCPVSSTQDQLLFPLPFFGWFNDNIVLGQVDLLFGKTLAACVNGDLQFDPLGIRPAQRRDAVLCANSGNDTVRVLQSGETFTCRYLGLPVNLTAWQSGGYKLTIYGQSGDDTIIGGDTGPEVYCGGSGNDKLSGRGFINELNGGVGNDDINGGLDLDYMFGADGDDVIIDPGTGGWRRVCYTGGEDRTPSRVEGGNGNDCLQLSPTTESGWCFGQEEPCAINTPTPCHAGIWCGAGQDRVDNNLLLGYECEVRTSGQACKR